MPNTPKSFNDDHDYLSYGRRVRFLGVLCAFWMAVWFPAYAAVWGWANFLHVCNMAVILSCLGFILRSKVIIASQALVSLLGDFFWILDLSSRIVSGHHLFGGTEYMWDSKVAFWVRCLSLYHFILPFLLLWFIYCFGYDRRSWKLQGGITLIVLVLSRLTDPAKNINFVFFDPIFRKSWGPAVLHVSVIWIGFMVLIYWPTHIALRRLFREPQHNH